MTVINKIREKSGLMIGVIAAALGLFILSDLFSSGGGELFGGNKRVVGEVAGDEVTLEEFSAEYERVRENYARSSGGAVPENLLPSIRAQAWQQILFQRAYKNECKKLGIAITSAELIDMIRGNNVHPGVVQSFANPETGELDRNALNNFLSNLRQYDPSVQASWQSFSQSLPPDRLRTKYENMLSKTAYVTSEEAKRAYKDKNNRADIEYLYVPLSTIPDSTLEISDNDLRSYFNKHKTDFEAEDNREIEYLSFPFRATGRDIAKVQQSLRDLIEPFKQTQNDTAFVAANSDVTQGGITSVSPSNVPVELSYEQGFEELQVGKVYGPYNAGKEFRMFKIIGQEQDSLPTARASHILFKIEDGKEAEALRKAKEVLQKIKDGANFALMAQAHGTDGTKERGGDLGWFKEGTMVQKFNDAVMNATEPGLLPEPLKTQFGYHLIKVTQTKVYKKYIIGTIRKAISPSDVTIDSVYRYAGHFTQYQNREELSQNLDSGMVLNQALRVAPTATHLNNLSGSGIRQVVMWAYKDDTKIGETSEIFDLENEFLIAIVNKKTKKGEASFENAKAEIRAAVLTQKKVEKIKEKLQNLGGTIEEIKTAYGTDAVIYAQKDLPISENNLQNIGTAPALIGQAFSLKDGEQSAPVETDNGVAIVRLNKLDTAPEVADYASYKTDLESQRTSATAFKIGKALEKLYKVKEQLYKYY